MRFGNQPQVHHEDTKTTKTDSWNQIFFVWTSVDFVTSR
jgi:hypothetical protein